MFKKYLEEIRYQKLQISKY